MSFAQFRWDEGQVEGGVDLCFGGASDELASLVDDAVFADGELAVFGAASQLDVVELGAGEVVDGGAPEAGLEDPQVGLEAGFEAHRGL